MAKDTCVTPRQEALIDPGTRPDGRACLRQNVGLSGMEFCPSQSVCPCNDETTSVLLLLLLLLFFQAVCLVHVIHLPRDKITVIPKAPFDV
jgi:hypothetical protein